MSGLKPQISGVRSDRSTNWATTTAHYYYYFDDNFHHWLNSNFCFKWVRRGCLRKKTKNQVFSHIGVFEKKKAAIIDSGYIDPSSRKQAPKTSPKTFFMTEQSLSTSVFSTHRVFWGITFSVQTTIGYDLPKQNKEATRESACAKREREGQSAREKRLEKEGH